MQNLTKLAFLFVTMSFTTAFYESSNEVVTITDENFESLVKSSDKVWIVEFYANWCGYSEAFVPDFIKIAVLLKGVVKVGAVDCEAETGTKAKLGVRSYPTIFILSDGNATKFTEDRDIKSIVKAAMLRVNKKIDDRLENL